VYAGDRVGMGEMQKMQNVVLKEEEKKGGRHAKCKERAHKL